MPSIVTECNRLEYDPASDTMYLGGYTTDRPHNDSNWGVVGTEIVRFDNWSAGNRTPTVRIVLPYQYATGGPYMKSMAIAGKYAFVVECKASTVHVYNLGNGTAVGTMNASKKLGHLGWVDIPYGIRAYKRFNGEYLVLVEEDGNGKVLIYRWTPATAPAAPK
jgi:hypothetical protein